MKCCLPHIEYRCPPLHWSSIYTQNAGFKAEFTLSEAEVARLCVYHSSYTELRELVSKCCLLHFELRCPPLHWSSIFVKVSFTDITISILEKSHSLSILEVSFQLSGWPEITPSPYWGSPRGGPCSFVPLHFFPMFPCFRSFFLFVPYNILVYHIPTTLNSPTPLKNEPFPVQGVPHWRVKSSGVRQSKIYKCPEHSFGR